MLRALVLAPLALATAGCNAAVWGNLAVLAISIAIFVSTLSLGVPAVRRSITGLSRSQDQGVARNDKGEKKAHDPAQVTARSRTRG